MSRAALRVRNLRKAYRGVVAMDSVDIEVREGECFGLLGPNGAGKTTTIEICEGLLDADSGEVEVLGMTWADQPHLLRNRLGVQLQETQFSERLTVGETLRLFRSFYSQGPSTGELIARFHLEEKRDARVGDLSGGQKQALALACSLAGNPDLLFLDEPTTGLDPQARRHLWEIIEQFKSGGRTIVLTTHHMDEAERLCDRIAIMDRGKVIALGTPRELIASIGVEHVVASAVPPAGGSQGTGQDLSTGGQVPVRFLNTVPSGAGPAPGPEAPTRCRARTGATCREGSRSAARLGPSPPR